MAGITQTSDLGDILPKFIDAVRFKLQEQVKARATVRVENLGSGQGSDFNIPTYAAMSAFALTEGVDMAQAQTMSDSNVQISPTEVGVQAVITRKALRRNKEPVFQQLRRIMTDALAKKEDQDIFDDAANFTTSRGTGAGNAFQTEDIFVAMTNLRATTGGTAGGPAPEPYFLWIHPNALYDIMADVLGSWSTGLLGTATPFSQGLSEDTFKRGFKAINGIADLMVVDSTNIAVDSGDDADNAALSKEAIIFVEEGEVEFGEEPDVSLRGVELNLVKSYATGEYEDTWGVRLISDALALT